MRLGQAIILAHPAHTTVDNRNRGRVQRDIFLARAGRCQKGKWREFRTYSGAGDGGRAVPPATWSSRIQRHLRIFANATSTRSSGGSPKIYLTSALPMNRWSSTSPCHPRPWRDWIAARISWTPYLSLRSSTLQVLPVSLPNSRKARRLASTA